MQGRHGRALLGSQVLCSGLRGHGLVRLGRGSVDIR